jgi:hypothetical protein
MPKIIIVLGASLIWMILMAWVWKPSLDPITGMGTSGYLRWVGLHGVLAAGSAVGWLATNRRWLAILGAALIAIPAIPMPSKAGVRISLHNPQSTPVVVNLERAGASKGVVTRVVPAGETFTHLTSGGDFSEDLHVIVTSPTSGSRISATLGNLRTHQIVLHEAGWALEKK